MDFDKIEQTREQYRKSLFGENAHFAGADIHDKGNIPIVDADIQNKRRIQIEDVEAFFRDYQPPSVHTEPLIAPEAARALDAAILDVALPLEPVIIEPVFLAPAAQEAAIQPNTTVLSVATLPEHTPKRADEVSKKRQSKELLVIIILIFVILLAIGSSILTSRGILDLGRYREFVHVLFGDVFGG